MRTGLLLFPLLVSLGFVQANRFPTLQAAAPQTLAPSEAKDSLAVFEAARPFYDFNSPDLKPWHLKASYQLYDDEGDPSEQGTFEYWWASPMVHRSTWVRPGATHTDWFTAEGKHLYQATGEAIGFSEYKLEGAFLSPLPTESDLDPAKVRPEKVPYSDKGLQAPCFMLNPRMAIFGSTQNIPLGLFPTYCFDPQKPVLLARFSAGAVAELFSKISTIQHRYIAREINFTEESHKILSASMDAATAVRPDDPAFVPAPDAVEAQRERPVIEGDDLNGMLIKKQFAAYPADSKKAHVSGKVVLHAIIGMDGGIHELSVVSAPWPSLALSALRCVSHWQYKPYLLNGRPVDVETTLYVVYLLNGR